MKKLKNFASNGWILPDGNYIGCAECQHAHCLPDTVDEDSAMKNNYVRIRRDNTRKELCIEAKAPLTQKQIDTLYDYCLYYNHLGDMKKFLD